MKNSVWRHICDHDKRLYDELCVIMDLIPDDVELGSTCNGKRVELSCHIVARGFANMFPHVRCVDGYFSDGFHHSWLMTEEFSLIDPFPVGMVAQPLLFWCHPACNMRLSDHLYQEEPIVMRGVYQHVGKWQFERAVEIFTQLLAGLR